MAEVKHRCRLYLQFPAQPSALIEAQLAQAIAGADTACVLICPDESPIDQIHAGRLVNLVQGRGLACLIENDIELAERLGADGAHIEADPAALFPGTRASRREVRASVRMRPEAP
jgi:thiamine-phosphate pyrophosphorylase